MGKTSIEWTHQEGYIGVSWNPTRGCSRVSPGCVHCYAETLAGRFSDEGAWAHGFAKRTKAGARWTGKVELVPHKLAEPLSWRKPRRVFVNSMSDLFHEKLTFEEIAAVIGVIAACPDSIFMTLTKRAARMREWFEWVAGFGLEPWNTGPLGVVLHHAQKLSDHPSLRDPQVILRQDWPLRHWQVGVSAEDQQRWDERVPELLRCPAAVRFVSAEPLLAGISIDRYTCGECGHHFDAWDSLKAVKVMCPKCEHGDEHAPPFHLHHLGRSICGNPQLPEEPKIDQIIIGGESGPGARPCHVEWIRDLVAQCRAAGVKPFCKQLGANPIAVVPLFLKDKKGGNPDEWPEDLRVREQV